MLEEKVKSIKEKGTLPTPLFNGLITTAELKEKKSQLILVGNDVYSDWQEVVAVGPNVTAIKVGDVVQIKTKNFAIRKTNSLRDDIVKEYHEVILPISEFGGTEYMFITDRDVDFYWKGEDL